MGWIIGWNTATFRYQGWGFSLLGSTSDRAQGIIVQGFMRLLVIISKISNSLSIGQLGTTHTRGKKRLSAD